MGNWSQFHSRRIRVRTVGRLELLPPSTLAAVREAEAATKDYSDMHLTIAAAYGGREEIVDAVRGLLREQLAQNKTLKEVLELVTPEAGTGATWHTTSAAKEATNFDHITETACPWPPMWVTINLFSVHQP